MRESGAGGFKGLLRVFARRWPALRQPVRRVVTPAVLLLVLLGEAGAAHASVVEHGYLPLSDHRLLNYTLTLPSATGRFPVLLEYDPHSAGVTSDPSWNAYGYAMLGVNFRGNGVLAGHLPATPRQYLGT